MTRLHLPDKSKPYLMAHRGNRALYPENTVSAFLQAVLDGADIVETDLQLSCDGAFLCVHDPTLDRTTDGSGEVSQLSLTQVLSYNAAASRPDLPSEPIPTLEQLSVAVPSPTMVALELKSDAFLNHETTERLIKELTLLGMLPRTVMLSFSQERLEVVRAVAPEVPLGWITSNKPFPSPGYEMFGPYWPLLIMNPVLALITHLFGQLVCPLDPIPDDRLWMYRLLGCDAVLSDNPAKTAQALGRLEQEGQ